MEGRQVNPDQLLKLARRVKAEYPGVTLIKNRVGNLVIVEDDVYVAWLDLTTGEIVKF